MTDINNLLAEREKTHGDFKVHANVTQLIYNIVLEHARQDLTLSQKESLHMICHKIGRIAAGNPNVKDHWDDIAGYATLVANQLND